MSSITVFYRAQVGHSSFRFVSISLSDYSNGNRFNGACYFCRPCSCFFFLCFSNCHRFCCCRSVLPAWHPTSPKAAEMLVRAYLCIRCFPSGTMLSVIHLHARTAPKKLLCYPANICLSLSPSVANDIVLCVIFCFLTSLLLRLLWLLQSVSKLHTYRPRRRFNLLSETLAVNRKRRPT